MRRLLLASAALLALAGCSSGSDEKAARGVAVWFAQAMAADNPDPTTACSVLAPATLREAVAEGGGACEGGIVSLQLPAGTTPSEVDVFGDHARVVLDGDTVFLVRVDKQWRVTAAGCTPRGDLPYDCKLSGS